MGICHKSNLNNAFKFSGNSVRPAYPGFIVINIPTVEFRGIISFIKLNFSFFAFIASLNIKTRQNYF